MNSLGVNLTNIPDGCRQIFNFSVFSCLEPPVQKVECAGPWDVALLFTGLSFLFGMTLLFVCYTNQRKQKGALETGDVTYHPKQPTWVRRLKRIVKYYENIRIECADYTPDYKDNREKIQEAILWIQSIHRNIDIPKTARIISVPMANFKTGRSCTEFIPLSGMAPGAFLSYQVCGNFSFQVTKYVEDGVAYVAGYCMYIWSPYASSIDFSYKHIEKCIKAMPKYQLPAQALPPQELCVLDCEDKSEAVRIMENLKLAFCQVLQKPVMIGTDNGVIKHFEWHSRCFMVSECSSCCLTPLEENPPSYQSLITP